MRYLGAMLAVAAAGAWLPFAGNEIADVEIADVMGWRTSLVGTLFIAGVFTGTDPASDITPWSCWKPGSNRPALEPYSPTNPRSFLTVSAASSASSVVRTVISPVRLCKTL